MKPRWLVRCRDFDGVVIHEQAFWLRSSAKRWLVRMSSPLYTVTLHRRRAS